MTFSSERTAERGLDAMLIVYSLLADHPASLACERFIRERSGWFTPVLTNWLISAHPDAADDFWSVTGSGSHLP